MKHEAYGHFAFENTTDRDKQQIEAILVPHFPNVKEKEDNSHGTSLQYIVDGSVSLDTTKSAIREICRYHGDKLDWLEIYWKEDETEKHHSNNEKRSHDYSRRVDFLSEWQQGKLRIFAEEESATFASSEEVFF